MQRKTWSEYSPGARLAVILGATLELVLTMLALRDLRRRPRELVRGPKWVWRLVAFVQPVGPPAYLLLGRRSTSEA